MDTYIRCFKGRRKQKRFSATDRDNISEYKRQKLYANGVKRYNEEMDLVGLLKTIRQVKIFFRTMLKQKQRAMLMV